MRAALRWLCCLAAATAVAGCNVTSDSALSTTKKPNEPNKKANEEIAVVAVGRTAPEIAGIDVDGKNFKLGDYRGKVVLLDFWGNW